MTRCSTTVFVASLCGLAAGCHLFIDPDEFRGHELDAAPIPDAAIVDAPPADVDQQALMLDSVEPPSVFEGQGSFAGGPGVPVVILGSNIAVNATVTVAGVDGATIEQTRVSMFAGSIGFVLRVPIDTTRAQGSADQVLTVTVTQPDGVTMATIDVAVVALDEFLLTGAPDVAMLRERYSTITTTGAASLRGPTEARLVATGSIEVSLAVDANGIQTTTTGAGGCGGGGGGVAGGCGAAGGTQGGSASNLGIGGGGGGGGARATGINGGSGAAAGGPGGMVSGDDYLTPLVGGNGGGGGGAGGLVVGIGTPGGAAGAGGGAIELTSEGSLSISAGVSVLGGAGATAGGGCSSGGGGGGGGSGGALLLRAAGVLTLGAPLRAIGGVGGNSSDTGCSNAGGKGADGYVRVDGPSATVAGVDAMPAATRGPMWAPDTALVVGTATPMLVLFGSSNRDYGITVGDGRTTTATPGVTGSANVPITLEPGVLTPVCAYVSPSLDGTNLSLSEAKNCRSLVYIP